ARIPTLWWIIASGAILNFIAYAFYVFLSSFLIRVHGLSIGSTGIAAGLLYGIGGVCGGAIAGWVGDWVIHVRKDGRMLAAAPAGSEIVTEAFKAIGLRQAMLVIPALAVVLALVLYAGSRTMRKDAGQAF